MRHTRRRGREVNRHLALARLYQNRIATMFSGLPPVALVHPTDKPAWAPHNHCTWLALAEILPVAAAMPVWMVGQVWAPVAEHELDQVTLDKLDIALIGRQVLVAHE